MAMYPNIANRRVDFELASGAQETVIWGPITTTTTIGIAAPNGDLSLGSGVDIELALIYNPHDEANAIWYSFQQGVASRSTFTVSEAAMAFRFTNNTDGPAQIQVNR